MIFIPHYRRHRTISYRTDKGTRRVAIPLSLPPFLQNTHVFYLLESNGNQDFCIMIHTPRTRVQDPVPYPAPIPPVCAWALSLASCPPLSASRYLWTLRDIATRVVTEIICRRRFFSTPLWQRSPPVPPPIVVAS